VTGTLERRLHDLGAALELPPGPDVAAIVALLPERAPARLRVRARLLGGPARRALAAALALALLAAGTALAVPTSRHAILRGLGLEGVGIERTPQLPAIPPGRLATLDLGRPIALAQARRGAGFAALTTPRASAAYVAHDLPGGRLTLVAGRELIFEFRGRLGGPVLAKLLGTATRAGRVRVNGGRGAYLSGAPHELFYLTPTGRFESDAVRLVGNVLIWQQGPLTLRIEGSRTLGEALALARTLH